MSDVIIDTLVDSLKLLPFLFLTYLLMEYIEDRLEQSSGKAIKGAGRFGPLAGGAIGMIPQCGFSAAAANLYAGRVITPGTLIAVFLSTSDEMLPIFISSGAKLPFMLEVLLIKMVLGIIGGLITDLFFYNVFGKSRRKIDIHHICENEHCHCHDDEHSENHSRFSILKPALKHTFNVFFFILLFSFILNLLFHFVGEDSLKNLVDGKPFISNVICAVIGLIPNCASSVAITQLYLEGVISFGSMMSGLLVGAGVGLLVLFRVNDNKKEDFIILSVLLAFGIIFGTLIEFIPIF